MILLASLSKSLCGPDAIIVNGHGHEWMPLQCQITTEVEGQTGIGEPCWSVLAGRMD